MRLGCLRCWRRDDTFAPAAMIYDPWGRPYEARCANCNEQMADEQAESDFAAYHGSSVPQNDRERCEMLLREGRA
jgi:hypothetical protein